MTISVRAATVTPGTGGTSVEAVRPAGTLPGDQLWAVHLTDTSVASMTAAGWSPVRSFSGNAEVKVWRRTALSGDSATFTFGQADLSDGFVYVFAVVDSDPTVSAVVEIADTVADTVATPDVNPPGVPHLELRVAAMTFPGGQLTWGSPAGYTARGSAQSVLNLLSSAAASRVLNSSSTPGAAVFTASPAAGRFGVGVSISLAAVAASEPEIPTYPDYTPARGDAPYQYRFRRLRDGQFVGFLELANVTFDKRINQAGTFSAQVPIPSSEVGDLVSEVFPRDSSVLSSGAGVVVVDILRDGDIWGEYWITSANPSSSGRGVPSLQLQGTTLEGYMSVVELQTDLFFTQADQIDILRGLTSSMQAQQYANVGLTIPAGMSGALRDRTYADDGGTYGQRIRELAEVDNGFECTVDVFASGGTVVRQLKWGYPKLGDPDFVHVIGYGPNGGEITAFSEQVDALRGATRYRARGGTPPSTSDASVTAAPLMSTVHEATGHLAAGWPRIDRTMSYSDVVIQQTLEDYAGYWASIAPGALRVETYTVELGGNPSLHPNKLGDVCRIYLENEWHRPHWRQRRIIGLRITPPARSDGKEQAELVLEGQEDGARRLVGSSSDLDGPLPG